MSTAPSVLKIDGLTVALPEGGDRRYAVEAVSLSIHAGEMLCLVGESGSGKSVTAQAVIGMLPPSLRVVGGTLRLEGTTLPPQRHRAFERLRGPRIAMVFQDAAASLDPVQRVGRQIEEVLEIHGFGGRSARRQRALALIGAVRLPDPERVFKAYPHQLSGGQCQRIVIAIALALDPVLLIADEPTTALDVTTQAEILKLFAELQAARGAAALFITHDMGVVAEIADRVAVMRVGRIVETGTRDEVLNRPQHPYTRQLLAAARATGDRRPRQTSQPILEADGVTRIYRERSGLFASREVHAVKNVSLRLRRRQTLGVVGESGSGKSTLARCLLRLEPIDGGRVLFEGQDMTHRSERELRALRQRIQVVLQDPFSALDPRQRVGDAVAEGLIIHGASRSAALSRAREFLAMVGLSEQAAERFPHEFSGGQRQRICIARALVLEPEVLIADEPVSSLDVSIQAQLIELFTELQRRIGFAMLFITHDLRLAAAICDEIMVMRGGEVVEHGPPADVLGNPQQAYTQQLVAAAPGGLGIRDAA